MTNEELNIWERKQGVIEVLTSREMGAWLHRRDLNWGIEEKYKKLKEAVGKIKEEVNAVHENAKKADICEQMGLLIALRIINRHTEGLI